MNRLAAFLFFAFAAGAVVVVGYLSMKRPEDRLPAPVPTPAPAGDPGGKGPGPKPPSPAPPKREPAPPEEPVPATREGRLAFLVRKAGPAAPPGRGMTIFLFPEVRADALEALELLPGHDAAPLVLAALGGDGDPEDWGEDRLFAAELRARKGHPDGPETVKAWLKSGEDLSASDALAEGARAASWMSKEEGGAAVARLLALDLDGLDEEDLAEILEAAAVLGAGASKEELAKFVGAEDGTWEPAVLGGAAGALLRLGDDSGKKVLQALRADDWFGAEEFALALGARGNGAAIPWLREMLACESEWTQAAAAAALGAVGGEEAKALLRKALANPAAEVAQQAAVSLALLGDGSGVERIREATKSKDGDLAIPAWKALALLGDAGWRAEAEGLLATAWPSASDPRNSPETRKRIWAALLLLRLDAPR